MNSNVNLVLNEINESARGPTNFSHWVIPNHLLASAYPGERNSSSHIGLIEKIINEGLIEVVVNLMEKHELVSFNPYEDIMIELAKKSNRSMEFLSFPIKDGDINQDDQCVLNFCLDLCDRLRRGQRILVHCWGGHGRTGTIISILIGILFNKNGNDSLSINSRLHDQRVRTNGIPSPETPNQLDQVRRIIDELYPKFNSSKVHEII